METLTFIESDTGFLPVILQLCLTIRTLSTS